MRFALSLLVAALSIFIFANLTVRTAVPIYLQKLGEPDAVIGLVSSAYPLGFLMGCLAVAPLAKHIKVFPSLAAMSLLIVAVTLAFLQMDGVVGWTTLRWLSGVGQGGVLTLLEAWLQSLTPSNQRGRVTATYQIMAKVAGIGGQSLIAAEIPDAVIFTFSAFCFLAVLAPVAAAPRPSPPTRVRPSLMALLRMPAVAASGCIAAGLLNLAMMSLGPVYMLQAGYSVADAGILAIAMQVSAIALQFPLGWASDRFDRRAIVLVIALGVLIGALLVLYDNASYYGVIAGFTFAGGLSQGLYAQASADAYDRTSPADIMPMSSALNVTWSFGSISGPIIASTLMSAMGRDGLPTYVAGVGILVSAHTAWMLTGRRA